MEKIIFLDVDGVLVSGRCVTYDFEESDATLFFSAAYSMPFERKALAALQRLVQSSGARIVVSSTWRGVPDAMQHLQRALAEFQMGNAVLDTTAPLGELASRGAEIESWVSHHPALASFVILEDSSKHVASFVSRPALAQRFVQTYLHEAAPPSPQEECLTEAHVEAALKILATPQAGPEAAQSGCLAPSSQGGQPGALNEASL